MVTILAERSDISTSDQRALGWTQRVQHDVGWTWNKQPFERQWAIAHAFYLGHQDIRWDGIHQRPVARDFPRHRSRYTANKVLGAVEKGVSLLCQNRPRWTSKPRTSSSEDLQSNRIAVALLEHFWDELEMEEKFRQLAMWAAITGTGFLYNTTRSDARTKQRAYIDPASRQPIPPGLLTDGMRRMLEQAQSYVDYFGYEPDVDVLSPFRLAFDPTAGSVEKSRRAVHIVPMDIDEVYERWQVIVSPEKLPDGLSMWEQRLRSFWGPLRGSVPAQGDTDPSNRGTVVREILSKPYVERRADGRGYDEFPDGRHVVIAGGSVLHDGPNPYWQAGFRAGFPFQPLRWHQVPARIWGMGLVEVMIDPQKAYNDVRRRTIDLFRLAGQPKWLAAYGADLKRDAIDDKPGEVIQFNAAAGAPPVQVTPTPFAPGAVEVLFQGAGKDLQDSAAQHDLLEGAMPSEMRSAPALQLVRENDLFNLQPKVRDAERCLSTAGENLIRTAAEILDDNAAAEILGPDHDLELMAFRPAMLKGVKSIQVIRGSLMPTSAALEFQKALDMVQAGGLNPGASEADRAVLIRAAQFNEFDRETQAIEQEQRRAERENEQMFQPLQSGLFSVPPVLPFDNDVLHLKQHYQRIRTTEFDRLPPAQKQAIMGHTWVHEERLRQAEQARLQATIAIKGSPGQKGQPSPPKASKSN